MPVLCLDTTTRRCHVAVYDEGGTNLLACRVNEDDRSQSEIMISLIDDVLTESQITLSDLKAVTVCTGPGSFTGIRVGLSVAAGLNLAAKLNVIGTNLFTLGQLAIEDRGDVGSVRASYIFAASGRRDYFVYPANEDIANQETVRQLPLQELRKLAQQENISLFSFDNDLCAKLEQEDLAVTSFEKPLHFYLARYAGASSNQNPGPARWPQPFYVRPPDVSLPKNKTGLTISGSGISS